MHLFIYVYICVCTRVDEFEPQCTCGGQKNPVSHLESPRLFELINNILN